MVSDRPDPRTRRKADPVQSRAAISVTDSSKRPCHARTYSDSAACDPALITQSKISSSSHAGQAADTRIGAVRHGAGACHPEPDSMGLYSSEGIAICSVDIVQSGVLPPGPGYSTSLSPCI